MSKKHVEQYYEEVCAQYKEMLENIHDFEELAQNNIISPERLEEYNKNIITLKTNWERISYIMFLLNKPNKKEKQKKYERQNQKLLNGLDKNNSPESVLEENRKVIENQKVL